MLHIAQLPKDTLDKIKAYRYDYFIEKHEGPARWETMFRYGQPEFLDIGGQAVLLPVGRDHHPNITVLRSIVS